jgi:hypothetical protein
LCFQGMWEGKKEALKLTEGEMQGKGWHHGVGSYHGG